MGNRKERDREERKSNRYTAAERGGKTQMDKEIERL